MKKVLRNARIYTCDAQNPWAETVVTEDDTVIYAGRDMPESWEKFAGKDADIYDMNGKMIFPGIIDSHTHPGMCSQSTWHIRLPWTEDPEVLLDFVRKYAEEHPKEDIPFLYFEYYPTSMFGSKGPSKELLDTAVSDRPCFCQDFGEHLHWMNSKMLEMMGVDKNTPDPVPGLEEFVRDEDGNPTGWAKELVWLRFQDRLYENIGWEPPMTMTPEIMQPFFLFLNDNGITAMSDGILEGEEQAASMYELDEAGRLNTYYDGIVRFWSYADLPEKIADIRRFSDKYSTKHIKFNTMKLFLDGTNESGNSAVLSPHLNDPDGKDTGQIKMETEELKNCLILCNREALDIQIHMVGDRAFRVGCDAVEAARAEAEEKNEKWVCQPVFLHCELIDPADMARPAELGITVNWSCHWSGGYFGEEAKEFIGEEKWRKMYQFNPIIDSGALVTFSSDVVTDYELHRANPFFSMQVANTRVDPEFPLDQKKYPGSVRPEESAKISRETLIRGYTISGAKQLRWESRMGSIEPGKLANMIVISDDFFKVPADKIKDISIDAVMFDGEVLRGQL